MRHSKTLLSTPMLSIHRVHTVQYSCWFAPKWSDLALYVPTDTIIWQSYSHLIIICFIDTPLVNAVCLEWWKSACQKKIYAQKWIAYRFSHISTHCYWKNAILRAPSGYLLIIFFQKKFTQILLIAIWVNPMSQNNILGQFYFISSAPNLASFWLLRHSCSSACLHLCRQFCLCFYLYSLLYHWDRHWDQYPCLYHHPWILSGRFPRTGIHHCCDCCVLHDTELFFVVGKS